MNHSRRQFVSACATAVAGLAGVPWAALGAAKSKRCVSLGDLRFDHFSRQLHTPFQVADAAGGSQNLTLCDVFQQGIQTSSPMANGPYESFSLMFQGDPERVLGQDTYDFMHDSLGRFDMFIVPVGPAGTGRYQAILSRLKPSLEPQPV
jgi:hypothetical protein